MVFAVFTYHADLPTVVGPFTSREDAIDYVAAEELRAGEDAAWYCTDVVESIEPETTRL